MKCVNQQCTYIRTSYETDLYEIKLVLEVAVDSRIRKGEKFSWDFGMDTALWSSGQRAETQHLQKCTIIPISKATNG